MILNHNREFTGCLKVNKSRAWLKEFLNGGGLKRVEQPVWCFKVNLGSTGIHIRLEDSKVYDWSVGDGERWYGCFVFFKRDVSQAVF